MEAQLSSEEPQQQPPIEILLPVQNHADTLVEPPMQVRGAALLHSLQKQARRRRTIFYSICVPIFATALLLAPMYASDAPRLSAIVTLGMLWSLIGLGLICVRPSRGQMEAIKRLGLTDSLEAIPALLDSEAYVTLGPDGRNVKRAALIALLQRLKASDRSLLSDKHLGRLYYDLSVAEQLLSPSWGKRNSAEEYLLAILKALEQVGDHRAIKYVERVANMKAKAPAAIRVRDAASE